MSIAPLKPVDLSGPSQDTDTYTQQLFAIEAGSSVGDNWPSEATDPGNRPFAIVQQVAAILGTGRHYTDDPLLSCDQVTWAWEQANAHPSWNLNPVYFKALERGAEVASRHTGKIPWATKDQPLKLVPAGSFGVTPVSGYYGTGHGTLK